MVRGLLFNIVIETSVYFKQYVDTANSNNEFARTPSGNSKVDGGGMRKRRDGVVAVGHGLQGRCRVDGVDVVTWRLASRYGLGAREGRGRWQWLGLPLSCPGL
jgi:hypothetical protein